MRRKNKLVFIQKKLNTNLFFFPVSLKDMAKETYLKFKYFEKRHFKATKKKKKKREKNENICHFIIAVIIIIKFIVKCMYLCVWVSVPVLSFAYFTQFFISISSKIILQIIKLFSFPFFLFVCECV